jgi:hypothetical protein
MGMSICDWLAINEKRGINKAARGTSCLVCHVLGLREVFLRSLYYHQPRAPTVATDISRGIGEF